MSGLPCRMGGKRSRLMATMVANPGLEDRVVCKLFSVMGLAKWSTPLFCAYQLWLSCQLSAESLLWGGSSSCMELPLVREPVSFSLHTFRTLFRRPYLGMFGDYGLTDIFLIRMCLFSNSKCTDSFYCFYNGF